MRVLQLIPAFKAGGAEKSALEIGQALVAAGHQALVVAADGPWRQRFADAGIATECLPVGAKSPALAWAWWRLPAVIARFRPDIVHVRSRLPAWLLAGRRRALGSAKLVSTLHGMHSVSGYSAVMTRADRLIAVSRCCADYWQRHYPGLDRQRLRIIPRGIDPSAWPRRERRLPPPPDLALRIPEALREAPLLVLPGRATRLKGHDLGLALLAELKRRGFPAVLHAPGLCETGREGFVRGLLAEARRLGVAECFLPDPPRDDLARIHAAASVVLQLSRQPESFGRTVLEALSVGAPVVGFDLGGVGESLRDLQPDGLVPPFDVGATASRVIAACGGGFPVEGAAIPTLARMQSATLELYRELVEVGTTRE